MIIVIFYKLGVFVFVKGKISRKVFFFFFFNFLYALRFVFVMKEKIIIRKSFLICFVLVCIDMLLV